VKLKIWKLTTDVIDPGLNKHIITKIIIAASSEQEAFNIWFKERNKHENVFRALGKTTAQCIGDAEDNTEKGIVAREGNIIW
jgi:hypothetical protein